jgi:hypothetical protein
MKPAGEAVRCSFCAAANTHDNPYDWRTQPAEHAAWRDAFEAVCHERRWHHQDRIGGIALREDVTSLPDQREFALIWRPFRHPFRLRVNDVVRLEGRLGRVVRVTECAAVVLLNRPVRQFNTRFDKPVRFQPSPATFRISANAEIEILNRKRPKRKQRKPL